MSINHNKQMNFAILQADRALGCNRQKKPSVGCVIVKNDILIAMEELVYLADLMQRKML